MAFQLSPGVVVDEVDLTNVVPTVSVSTGGFCGTFQWGPVASPTLVSSEADVVRIFGKPNALTASSFFTAANFLAYSNNLQLVRAVGSSAKNAVAAGSAVLVQNIDDWTTNFSNGQASVGSWAAKFPGVLGNALLVSMADEASFGTWSYKTLFPAAPGTSDWANSRGGVNDEVHVVVVDTTGAWTGTAGTVLETFAFLSKGSDVKANDGTNSYYKTVIANSSKYIWWMDFPSGMTNWGVASPGTGYLTLSTAETVNLTGGVSSDDTTVADLTSGFDLFANADVVDVSLLMVGEASLTIAQHVIQDIAEVRRDCVAFVSPTAASVVGNAGNELTDVLADRTTLGVDSSYGVMDSGWKYQYDKYNDLFRWVPLNGDIAGLCAQTDNTNDPWFSPGGLNRGQIKNVVKLAWSPNQAQRDSLYSNGINPVVQKIGAGTVLWGDKTLQTKPSAFDRINVRRLFIVLEKSIARAAEYELFEFNDTFTQAQFRSIVEPFLRDVQGRRGITDFDVVCDSTNNTPDVVDANQFVGDIYVKPARSINFIQLNFIAVRTGVAFEEIVGTQN